MWFSFSGLYYGPNQTFDSNLTGLISQNFSKTLCLSRYEALWYYQTSPHMPSSYLLQKLRNYEALHKKCGPNTLLYRKSIQQLKTGHSMESIECNYVVWIPRGGLGNQILSLTSTFLYAMLTNRVLLIQLTDELVDLFCEPFPDTSWILPHDFPIKNLQNLDVNSKVTYGNLLEKHVISNDPIVKIESLPSYVYVHLCGDYHDLDKLFYCYDDQIVLQKVNWLLFKSDLYFVPSIYSTLLFEEELNRLFPSKESTFHLLVHYLIHPSNTIWKLIREYYMTYLAMNDEKIGVQIRVPPFTKVSSDVIFQHILDCSKMESVLPGFDLNDTTSLNTNTSVQKSKAILVVSLYAEYYKKFKLMYKEYHSVKTRDVVRVYQPSHEERQRKRSQLHNQKALVDIYLLSLCNVLMTSGMSTFGYVSYGLAGLKPVILMPIWGRHMPDVPCVRETSIEPCHHNPPRPSCKGKMINMEKQKQYIKPCPDNSFAIKLFD
jgi:xyloglucan fucosyltransferase